MLGYLKGAWVSKSINQTLIANSLVYVNIKSQILLFLWWRTKSAINGEDVY